MKWVKNKNLKKNTYWAFVLMTLLSWFMASSTCYAREITEAFGYTLGAPLSPEDIITKRSGIGPHDIIPKKKARTVKKVQAYTLPGDDIIFSVDGKNYFGSMSDCSRMASAISYFLQKKFADVIDKQEKSPGDSQESGILFSDTDGGKTVSVTCTNQATTFSLSIRYTDTDLAKKALKNLDKKKNNSISDSAEVRL